MASSAYKIDKGLPVPPHGKIKYPFAEMAVGDSFFDPVGHSRIRAAASSYGKDNDKQFSVHRDGDGLRVWRVA